MLIVDLNLLLYASNRDAPQHDAARVWWEAALTADETVGLPWAVVLGFVRLVTNRTITPRPLRPAQALEIVDDWLAQPSVRIAEPTERHWGILKDLLGNTGTAANLTTDAHLAALAIEHGATLCSADRDFGRFERLRVRNPLER
jgi:toxin-antitoxin system PIN domain toxin